MMRLWFCLAVIFFGTADVYALDQQKPDEQSPIEMLMMQYDFNHDGLVNEREFIIGDGESGYRAHLSNIHKALKIEDNDHISKQQYWFVEMGDPAKYKKDLAAYFGFLDKDGDGYVSAAEYLKTFEGQYPPDAGEKYLKIMDIDMDNRLSKSEYINFDFTTLPSDSHELFHNLDANHDSFITFDEFKSSLELSW